MKKYDKSWEVVGEKKGERTREDVDKGTEGLEKRHRQHNKGERINSEQRDNVTKKEKR